MKAMAGGWILTGVGVPLGLGGSLALAIAGPGPIDPARECRYRFDVARDFTVRERAFPPRATCVRDDGRTFEYLSSGTTLVGTVLLVAAALLVLAGAALLAVTWLRRDAVAEPPRAGSRPAFVWLTLLVGLTVNVLVLLISLALYIFIGVLAAAFFVMPALLGATMIAAAIDQTTGPGGPGRRRRATTVAVIGGLAGLALVWTALATDVVPLGDWALFSIPLAGLPCVAIAAAQHLRAPRPA